MIRLHKLLPTLILVLVGGCGERSPTDEAIAFVDGRPLTRGDLAADLKARRLSTEAPGASILSAVTTELIDRSLLAKQARSDALDEDPDYQAAAARAQEMALVQHLLDRWRLAVPTPSHDEVQIFMDSNPQMFADRVIYLLDEVQTELTGLDERALRALPSMDAVIDYLRQHNHPYRRGSATFDTLTMVLSPARRIAQLAPGEPFISTRGTTLIVRAVTRSSPAPLVGQQGAVIARQLWQRAIFQRVVQQKLRMLRAAATIAYPTTVRAS